MSKFKVGDRVRVIKTGCKSAAAGYYDMLGKATEIISKGSSFDWRVRCIKDDSSYWAFNENELELVSEGEATTSAPTITNKSYGLCLNEKTLADQLKEAEALVSELKAKIEREKNFVDKYEFEFYVNSCRPVLHKGVSFDAYSGLGIKGWNPTRTDSCTVKYKLTLERIKEE